MSQVMKILISISFHLQVISLDVTSGGLCVSVCTENKLQIWDTRQGLLMVSQNSHLSQEV